MGVNKCWLDGANDHLWAEVTKEKENPADDLRSEVQEKQKLGSEGKDGDST